MELSMFLKTIHHDTDLKCHASILGNWFDPNRNESVFNDQYFNIDEFINTSEHLAEVKMDDIYFSLNSYRKHRCEKDVWHLNAFAIDYDYYKINKYKDLTAEEMYEVHIEPTLKFKPTFVIDSGRGLYVLYVFKHCSRVRTKLYRSIYKYLLKDQENFGADTKATLVTQVIRLPGTINSRNSRIVEVIRNNHTEYDILDFVKVLPFSLEEVENHKKHLMSNSKVKMLKTVDMNVTKKDRQRECNYFDDVYKDLKRLIKLRNAKNENVGYREYLLFLVQYMHRYYNKSPKEALNYALKLNTMLNEPMTDKEVRIQCKPSKICSGVMSVKTIISKLEITIEEQKELNTLVSDDVKYEQQKMKKKAARRKLKYLNRTEKEYQVFLRRDMVIKLKRKGYKNSKIAEELNVSKQIVSVDLSYIKEHAYEFIQKIEEIMNEIYSLISVDNFTRYVTQKFNKTLTKWLEIAEESLE